MASPGTTAVLLALVPSLPLAGFLLIVLLGSRLPKRWAGAIASSAVGLAFLASVGTALAYGGVPESDRPVVQRLWRWIEVGHVETLVTVALEPLGALAEIEGHQVGQVWWPANASVLKALENMWAADAVVGIRPIYDDVLAGDILTSFNVPPAPTLVAAEPMFRAPFEVAVAFQLDALSIIMILVVTGVGFLIHAYSIGYMAGDPGVRRYFAYLNLFVFSMLILVLAADFLVLFVGWELVGLCSYLLIGFWYTDQANASAGRKAFIVNRVGDLAFLVGLMLIWSTFGSLAFADVLPAASERLVMGGAVATAIAACLLIGAAGKSAQLPLHVWLPDAMAGPTPVSALIHAATMVTAGVYMIVRAHALFEQSPAVLAAVATIGALTALMAALVALVQVDIKRVLAYSTISQLGYMMMGVGAAAYAAGIFHLMTHAFFKALLFLGAGSVMHAMEHGFRHSGGGRDQPPSLGAPQDEADPSDTTPAHQDMRRMGGLWKVLPRTAPTFAIGAAALAGLFPLAGFWSKDEILLETLARGGPLWTALYLAGLVTAFLTALYTGRALAMVFAGPPRSAGARHAHESPLVMTAPLIVLALLSVVGGVPGVRTGDGPLIGQWLAPVVGEAHHGEAAPPALLAAIAATMVAVAGLAVAWAAYGPRPRIRPAAVAERFGWAYRAASNGFYVDRIYETVVVGPFRRGARFAWRVVDDGLVDGAVNGIGRSILSLAQLSRRYQSGYARAYALSMIVGAAAIAAAMYWAGRS